MNGLNDPLVLLIHKPLDLGFGGPVAQNFSIVDLLSGDNSPLTEDQGQDVRVLLAQILRLDMIFGTSVIDVCVETRNHRKILGFKVHKIADNGRTGKAFMIAAGGMCGGML